jgi:hypothetical protein
MWVDGQTDRHDEVNSCLCNFANIPKKEIDIRLSTELTKLLTIRLCKRATKIVTPSQ